MSGKSADEVFGQSSYATRSNVPIRGYRNIFPFDSTQFRNELVKESKVDMLKLAQTSTSLPKEKHLLATLTTPYPKPRRKEPLSLTRKCNNQQYSHGIASVTAAIQLLNGKQNAKIDNPVSLALYSKNTKECVRPPPRLPPAYVGHLAEIQFIQNAFRELKQMQVDQDKSQQPQSDSNGALLHFKFNDQVKEKVMRSNPLMMIRKGLLGKHEPVLFSEEDIIKRVDSMLEDIMAKHHIDPSQFPHHLKLLHKTSWYRDALKMEFGTVRSQHLFRNELRTNEMNPVIQLNGEKASEITDILTSAIHICKENKTTDPFTTRNVPYMLHIWQQMEGINLEQLVTAELGIQVKATKHSDILAESPYLIAENNSDYTKVLAKQNLPLNSPRILPEALNVDSKPLHGGPNMNDSLSYSEFRATNDSQDNNVTQEPIVSLPDNVTSSPTSEKLPAHIFRTCSDFPSSRVADEKSLSYSTVRFLKKIVKENLDDKNANERTVKEVLKVALVGSDQDQYFAEGGVYNMHLSDAYGLGSEMKDSLQQSKSTRKKPRKQSSMRPESPKTANRHIDEQNKEFIKNLDQDQGMDDLDEEQMEGVLDSHQPTRSKKPKTPTDIKSLTDGLANKLRGATGLPLDAKNEISSIKKKLAADKLLKQQENTFSLAHLVLLIKKGLKEHTLQRREIPQTVSPDGWSISFVSDILDTPFVSLTEAPQKGTEAYSVVVKTLILALREKENRFLRFEAVQLLILLQGFNELNRWDAMSYRKTLAEMLNEGTTEERLFAALSICSVKQPNYQSISTAIDLGLGNIDPDKSSETKRILLNLPSRYVPVLFDVCLKNCNNTSWRLRYDLIEILCKWIERLAEYKTTHPETSENIDFSSVNPMFENPVNRAVDALLNMMWNDWSSKVRTFATDSLARMGVGRAVFECVVKRMGDKDPSKRIEALESLGKLRILTAESLKSLLERMEDPYASVRVQACKVACLVATNYRALINKLLEKCDDYEWKVRAYSIKGNGCKSPKLKQTLNWILNHDIHPYVRAEALRALKCIPEWVSDKEIKDSVYMQLDDSSHSVRKEAEAALASIGISLSAGIGTTHRLMLLRNGKQSQHRPNTRDEFGQEADDLAKDEAANESPESNKPLQDLTTCSHQQSANPLLHRRAKTGQRRGKFQQMITPKIETTDAEKEKEMSQEPSNGLPVPRPSTKSPPTQTFNLFGEVAQTPGALAKYSHYYSNQLNSGLTIEEIDILLRQELVGEKEMQDVIEQVQTLTHKENVLLEMSSIIERGPQDKKPPNIKQMTKFANRQTFSRSTVYPSERLLRSIPLEMNENEFKRRNVHKLYCKSD